MVVEGVLTSRGTESFYGKSIIVSLRCSEFQSPIGRQDVEEAGES